MAPLRLEHRCVRTFFSNIVVVSSCTFSFCFSSSVFLRTLSKSKYYQNYSYHFFYRLTLLRFSKLNEYSLLLLSLSLVYPIKKQWLGDFLCVNSCVHARVLSIQVPVRFFSSKDFKSLLLFLLFIYVMNFCALSCLYLFFSLAFAFRLLPHNSLEFGHSHSSSILLSSLLSSLSNFPSICPVFPLS